MLGLPVGSSSRTECEMQTNSNKAAPSGEVLTRLIKLCGMLGSEHDGERASAALKASKLLIGKSLNMVQRDRHPKRRSRRESPMLPPVGLQAGEGTA